MAGSPDETTHFGSQSVPLGEKQERVNDVFHSVARRYDLMNDLMSAGLHRAWKDALVTALSPPRKRAFRHLDVAGGTGDVAFRVLDAGGRADARHRARHQRRHARGRPRARRSALRRPHRFRRGECGSPAARRCDASTATRSPSASATCRASTRRLRRRTGCCAAAAISCASNSRTSTCRASTRSTTPIRSTSSRPRRPRHGRRRILPLSRRVDPPLPAARRLRAHDRGGRLRARDAPRHDGRHRRHPFGLEDLT